jgi:hypothetical protein
MTRNAFQARTLRRSTTTLRLASCIALLAVLAQIAMPHLHRWLAGGHDGERVTPMASRLTVLADEQSSAAPCGEHTDPKCPTCQALAQTRSFLAARFDLPRLVALSSDTVEREQAPSAPERTVAHAPRSPPVSA